MANDIPVLKTELSMALPSEAQPAADQATRKLYEEANSAVLKIVTDKARPGSGFLLEDESGTKIITSARNVVGSQEQFAIASDGKRYKLEIEKLNELADLAVLKLKQGQIPDSKALKLGNTDELDQDSAVWTISHPHEAASLKPYISPGYAQGLNSPASLMSEINPRFPLELRKKLMKLDPESRREVSAYLAKPLFQSKLHIETGSVGSPVLDEKASVVGMTLMSDGRDLLKGQTLSLPAEAIEAVMADKGRFEFSYKYKAENWAESYLQSWKDDKVSALTDTAVVGGMAGVGLYGIGRYPFAGSLGLGLYSLSKFAADGQRLLESSDGRDTLKYSLAVGGDIGGLSGAGLMLASRFRGYGLLLASGGLALRAAADFVPNRWSIDQSKFIMGKAERQPFDFDSFMRP